MDSGNLTALLLTLKPGLLEMADTPQLDRRLTQGLLDTLDTLLDAYARTSADTQPLTALREQVQLAHGQVGDVYATLLPMLVDQLQPLITQRAALAPGTEAADDCTFWLNALNEQCLDLSRELQQLQLPPVTIRHPTLR